MYYQMVTVGCPKGYAYVQDYMGNKIYYGTLEECLCCIDNLMNMEVLVPDD